jgi:hypothetical protein
MVGTLKLSAWGVLAKWKKALPLITHAVESECSGLSAGGIGSCFCECCFGPARDRPLVAGFFDAVEGTGTCFVCLVWVFAAPAPHSNF